MGQQLWLCLAVGSPAVQQGGWPIYLLRGASRPSAPRFGQIRLYSARLGSAYIRQRAFRHAAYCANKPNVLAHNQISTKQRLLTLHSVLRPEFYVRSH